MEMEEDSEAMEFEESLTKEEREAGSYLAWSDARLGKATRLLSHIYLDGSGKTGMAFHAAAIAIACQAHESNASVVKFGLSGVTTGDEKIGDYFIAAIRTDDMSFKERMKYKLVKRILS